MDKEVSKRLLRDEGIRTARFISVRPDQNIRFDDVVSELGSTLFVKPASLGSSVGVNKVKNAEDFDTAINHAFRYDHKVLVEEFIAGREIECAVLESGGRPIATVPGEIAPASSYEYYSYEAKYTDASGAKLVIPADLPPPVAAEVQDIALRTFTALCAEGLARVDFFLTRDGQILVNEMNTMPGFTAISMYPKLWAASGLEYGALMDKLIAHAQARFAREQRLQTQLAERTERKSPGSA
jgi:D-alanine-D-alanine ligase